MEPGVTPSDPLLAEICKNYAATAHAVHAAAGLPVRRAERDADCRDERAGDARWATEPEAVVGKVQKGVQQWFEPDANDGQMAGPDVGAARTGVRQSPVRAAPPRLVVATFLAPALLLYTVFVIYPLVLRAEYSLFAWRGTSGTGFAGVDNFVGLFTNYPSTSSCCARSGHNGCSSSDHVYQNTVGLPFAVLLFRHGRARGFLALLHAPLPGGTRWSSATCGLMLQPTFGVVNALFDDVGLESCRSRGSATRHRAAV